MEIKTTEEIMSEMYSARIIVNNRQVSNDDSKSFPLLESSFDVSNDDSKSFPLLESSDVLNDAVKHKRTNNKKWVAVDEELWYWIDAMIGILETLSIKHPEFSNIIKQWREKQIEELGKSADNLKETKGDYL